MASFGKRGKVRQCPDCGSYHDDPSVLYVFKQSTAVCKHHILSEYSRIRCGYCECTITPVDGTWPMCPCTHLVSRVCAHGIDGECNGIDEEFRQCNKCHKQVEPELLHVCVLKNEQGFEMCLKCMSLTVNSTLYVFKPSTIVCDNHISRECSRIICGYCRYEIIDVDGVWHMCPCTRKYITTIRTRVADKYRDCLIEMYRKCKKCQADVSAGLLHECVLTNKQVFKSCPTCLSLTVDDTLYVFKRSKDVCMRHDLSKYSRIICGYCKCGIISVDGTWPMCPCTWKAITINTPRFANEYKGDLVEICMICKKCHNNVEPGSLHECVPINKQQHTL
jgi:hypothetical protein